MQLKSRYLIFTVAIIVFVFTLAAAFVGPGRIGRLPPFPPEVKLEKPEITLVVDFGTDIATVSTAARTPYEALTLFSEVQGVKVESKQYDFGLFVESVRDLPNAKDKAWIYFVNGQAGQVAADKYQLKDKDKVEWRYIEPID